jgi:hydroxymethylbilane synthase
MSWRMRSVDSSFKISVAARSSALSKAQVEEVYREISQHHPAVQFHPFFIETTGDRDLTTSLRTLDKTDFFTKEIDAFQLAGGCRISIHSAKDLPEPLTLGLHIAALTQGVDASDALVLRQGESIQDLPLAARIGTSSFRREQNIQALRSDLCCVDIRGSIEQRLSLLDTGRIDGLVVAEAALIRLQLIYRNRIKLMGKTAPMQGRLAVLSCADDEEMKQLFSCIDDR